MKKKEVIILSLPFLGGALVGFLSMMLWGDYLQNLWINKSFSFGSVVLDALSGFLAIILAFYFQIIIHEGGHLVSGLLTGYKFVSFRIGNLILLKEDGKLRLKKYSIPGTMGQCLMSPPTLETDAIPYKAYNIGGVLFNLIAVIISLLLLAFLEISFPFNFFLVALVFIGSLLILMNGIPMEMSGVANDAKNVIALGRDPIARKSFALQLRINALLTQGMRLRDMPDGWFALPDDINLNNYFHVSLKLLESGRCLDKQQFEEAYRSLRELDLYLPDMVGIYQKEATCERIFLEIILGNTQEAKELYTPEIKAYVNQTHKYMLSKNRLLYAYTLWVDDDVAKAEGILKEVLASREKFPAKGDTESEIEILEYVASMKDIDKNTTFTHSLELTPSIR